MSFLPLTPDRHDVRLKLLEVFTESADHGQFSEHAQYLVDNCQDEDILMAVRELETQIDDSQLDLDTDLVTADEVVEETTESDVGLDDDLELDLDDVEITDGGPQIDGDVGADDAEDSFELEFDDPEPEQITSSAGQELGGDLGIDFDPERDTEDGLENSSNASVLDDESADFNLDDMALDGADDRASSDNDTAEEVAAAVDVDSDGDDFDFDANGDPDINETKLDLAEAYVDMGDVDGARDILNEVADEGTEEQRDKARQMLEDMG
ncbi:MAG: FimV/HubP family polar landmark protein [Pseudomonadota bacterium]